MPLILRSSLERRIIEHALEHYPLTAAELARALGVPEKRVLVELRRMESRGLAELDVLPDKTYVRILVVPWKAPGPEGGKAGGTPPGYS
ncbi:MAG: winged helix-turn-helix domain-containing protein [Thermoplasmatota archaeon]